MFNHYRKRAMCIFMTLISCTTLTAQITPNANGIVFVNKNVSAGNQSGNSWNNAVPELADALLSAHSNSSIQQIWVAQGSYAPKYSAGTDNMNPSLVFGSPYGGRFSSFLLVNNVKIYGGFLNANETSISQRDSINSNTILNGLDSFVHVVMGVGNIGSAELNGFTIRGGQSFPYQQLFVNGLPTRAAYGGGIYLHNSNLAIKNCSVINNTANAGGGIYAENSTATLKRTAIRYNSAIATDGSQVNSSVVAFGGGMYFLNGSALTVDSCSISDNTALAISMLAMGGGLYIGQTNGASVNISNTTFNNNKVQLNLSPGATPIFIGVLGGGLAIHNPYQVSTLNNCVFSDNTAQLSAQYAILSSTARNEVYGGGLFTGSPLMINNSTINNNEIITNVNTAGSPGGFAGGAGIATDGGRVNGSVGGINTGVNITINNTIIENNKATGNFRSFGGGISYFMPLFLLPDAVKPKINNSIIRNNTAQFGGGIHCYTLAPVIKNTLLDGNTAIDGTAIYNESPGQSARPQLINCTVAGHKSTANNASIIANNDSSTTALSNCIVFDNSGTLSNLSNLAQYSTIESNTVFPGTGNKNQNPQFVNASIGNYELLNTSSAVNAGSNTLYAAVGNINSDTDLSGQPRLFENTVDMGAIELQTRAADTTTNTSLRSIAKNAGKVKVYPNPVLSGDIVQLQLDFTTVELKGASLLITDAKGRIIYEQTDLKTQLRIFSPQERGNYFVHIMLLNGDRATAMLSVY